MKSFDKETGLTSSAQSVQNYLRSHVFSDTSTLSLFSDDAIGTAVEQLSVDGIETKKYINEFWTSRQRQASSIHEISYRACFKPQLPRFFIDLLTQPGDTIYDPFSGRGTTVIEAALLGRKVVSNDVNPLSRILTMPRLEVPDLSEIEQRLEKIPIDEALVSDIDLSMFYHKRTEKEILSLRNYLGQRIMEGKEDSADRWIRMVATNRLTGHSSGFFSVYTLPPNQATSPERQKKINADRNQIPEYRNTKELILKKSCSLLKTLSNADKSLLLEAARTAAFFTEDARDTDGIADESIYLTVTSPPFLDVVQYSQDNWLRCWFNEIDVLAVEKAITMSKTLDKWTLVMGDVFRELYRITANDGWVAFEVGEVRNGLIRLEEAVIPLGVKAGFECFGVVINSQKFTKTSNIWGISNNASGTNTNRVVLFEKTD